MKSKSTVVLLIIVLVVLAISLTWLMIYLIGSNKSVSSFVSSSKEVYNKTFPVEDLTNFNVETISSDITFERSNSNYIEVKAYGTKNGQFRVENNNGNITIKEDFKNSMCFFFCFNNNRVIISVPDIIINKLDLKTTSGDVKVLNAIESRIKTVSGDVDGDTLNNLEIETTSGEVKIRESNNIKIKTISGDIELGKTNYSLSLITTSGDIEVSRLKLEEDSFIKTVSGSVSFSRVNDFYIETKTTSGEIEILNNNRNALKALKINTVSGDIEEE